MFSGYLIIRWYELNRVTINTWSMMKDVSNGGYILSQYSYKVQKVLLYLNKLKSSSYKCDLVQLQPTCRIHCIHINSSRHTFDLLMFTFAKHSPKNFLYFLFSLVCGVNGWLLW